MIVKEISLWGSIVVACLVVVATIVFAFIDRKMLQRMLVIFGATVAQMAAVAAVVLPAISATDVPFELAPIPYCSTLLPSTAQLSA